jgi:hypothetical protein
MDLMDSIKSAADLGAIKKIADKLDIEEHIARKALIDELVPAVSEGLKENVQSEEGANALASALDNGEHDKYIDDPEHLVADETDDDQKKIVGHALGDKEDSLVAQAAAKTGLSPDKIKAMLPMVGGLVMGGLSKSNKKAKAEGGESASSDSGESSGSSGGGIVGKLSGMLDPSDLKKYAEKLF